MSEDGGKKRTPQEPCEKDNQHQKRSKFPSKSSKPKCTITSFFKAKVKEKQRDLPCQQDSMKVESLPVLSCSTRLSDGMEQQPSTETSRVEESPPASISEAYRPTDQPEVFERDVHENITDEECQAACCQTSVKPYQPTDIATIKKKEREFSSKGGIRKRTFNPEWYKDSGWLSLCTTRNRAFCFTCRSAERLNLITFSKNAEPEFTKYGFNNWKKATEKFRAHETCSAHVEAALKLTEHRKNV